MRSRFIIPLIVILAAVLTGCGTSKSDTGKSNSNKMKVYATVYPLADFTEKIGGKYVEAETVYPPGTDEHSYEPSQKDIVSMAESDLFFYIGYNLEGFVTKAKPILTQEGVTVKAIGEEVKLEESSGVHHQEHDGHNHGSVNPHIWLDPVYAEEMAGKIKEELIAEMPAHKDYFEEQYKKLAVQFDDLDQQFSTVIGTANTKKIIVSHAAYEYWEDRYGLEQISVTGLTASSEPSQKKLQELVKTAKDNNLHYVLFEQNVSSKLTEIIQKEIGAESLSLHNLSVLTNDDIKNHEDYFSLMKKNADVLKKALN